MEVHWLSNRINNNGNIGEIVGADQQRYATISSHLASLGELVADYLGQKFLYDGLTDVA